MIKSMTGFASLTQEDARATIGVTVRTVNHRFLDVQLRMPQAFAELESKVRALISRRLARGRVEVHVSVQSRAVAVPTVELNEPFIQALGAALDRAREHGLVTGTLSAGDLVRLPQALTIREQPAEADPAVEAGIAASLEAAIDQALADLESMRVREGTHLRVDLDARLALLADLLEKLSDAAVGGAGALRERLATRIRDLSIDGPVDDQALAQEIVRFASRSDIASTRTFASASSRMWPTGRPSATPTNPAAASSTSCCRR